jgi:DNA-binding HxlR family transcriptional regulator
MGIRRMVRKDLDRRESEPAGCPLTAALQVIGGRWSLITLYWLEQGSERFNDLRRRMPSISHKVLAATLRDLEREGMISRTVIPDVPPKVAYAMTDYGGSLHPLIEAARQWGRHHLEWQANQTGRGKRVPGRDE